MLALFAWNLEETCKTRAKYAVLKGHLSPNSVIFINSSSAIPLLLEAACLQPSNLISCHTQLFWLPTAKCSLALPQGHNRTVTILSACYSLLYHKRQRGSVSGPQTIALKEVCFFYSVEFLGIKKFCFPCFRIQRCFGYYLTSNASLFIQVLFHKLPGLQNIQNIHQQNMHKTPLHVNKHLQRKEGIERDCALDKLMKYGQTHNRNGSSRVSCHSAWWAIMDTSGEKSPEQNQFGRSFDYVKEENVIPQK